MRIARFYGQMILIGCVKCGRRGRGVENPENFADVLYVWSPIYRSLIWGESMKAYFQNGTNFNLNSCVWINLRRPFSWVRCPTEGAVR